MARLLMLLALAVIAAALLVAALATATRGIEQAEGALRKGNMVQNVAYIALLVLLTGIVTGWIGGL
ncbi:hypothetical protein [Roseovarius salinarum]|uniref:hypothetical protein n=1 Tax=Roseovarius salinarum TaxID=1981892 RepID=UPI000C322CD1|nr:hypothetical protein [Roseovarius salinarum]